MFVALERLQGKFRKISDDELRDVRSRGSGQAGRQRLGTAYKTLAGRVPLSSGSGLGCKISHYYRDSMQGAREHQRHCFSGAWAE
jgi:hypothetical protein